LLPKKLLKKIAKLGHWSLMTKFSLISALLLVAPARGKKNKTTTTKTCG
jgi:hypothetical protein